MNQPHLLYRCALDKAVVLCGSRGTPMADAILTAYRMTPPQTWLRKALAK